MLTPLSQAQINESLQKLRLPLSSSHKGQNGKLLIIGGSQLFHSASRWSLDIASKLVDMVFYCSVPGNNQLIQQAKQYFWNGIVVARQEVESYALEADCILIGPGMERQKVDPDFDNKSAQFYLNNPPNDQTWQSDTQKIVNYLLAKFPDKKWVVDAGALQMVDIKLLNENCIITPHYQELMIVAEKAGVVVETGVETGVKTEIETNAEIETEIETKAETETEKIMLKKTNSLQKLSQELNNASILLKGQVDIIVHQEKVFLIKGGNAGMTKGGTGDVLAGLLAGLYANNEVLPSMITASHINKLAGDCLFKKTGPFFNASSLVEAIPEVLWTQIKKQ